MRIHLLYRITAFVALCAFGLCLFLPAQADSEHPELLLFSEYLAGAMAITPSDLDTMAFFNTFAGVGDTFFVDLHIVNLDTIGAYAVRAIYDTAVIEPLTDTVLDMGSPVHKLELQQLRGTAFEKFDGTVNTPGILTMLAADFDGDSTEAFAPGSGISARMAWRVREFIDTQTTVIVFENHPSFPESFNAITNFYGQTLVRPVLTTGTVQILPGPCSCPFLGDLDASGSIDAVDLNALIDLLFFGGASVTDPTCPRARADWNCDGFPDAADLNALIDGIFFVPSPPCDPCVQ